MTSKKLSTAFTIALFLLVILTTFIYFFQNDSNWTCQLELVGFGIVVGIIQLVLYLVIHQSAKNKVRNALTFLTGCILLLYAASLLIYLKYCDESCLSPMFG